MKYASLLLLLFICMSAMAQKEQPLEDVKAPSMPASSIIGIQSNEVNRPKSLKSLETAFLNNFQDNQNFILPNSFALEVNPFMLSGRKNFDYNTYLQNKVLQNIWQNFSVSISSTTNYFINDSTTANAMGLGFRTIILNGHPNPEIARLYKSSQNANQEVINIKGYIPILISSYSNDSIHINALLDSVINRLKSIVLSEESVAYQEAVKALNAINKNTPKDSIANTFLKNYKKFHSTEVFNNFKSLVKDVKMNRYGWRLEIDLAYALSFPDNNFNYSVSPRWGTWLNASYKPLVKKKNAAGAIMKTNKGDAIFRPSDFEFIGMARVFQNNSDFFQNLNPEDSTFKAGNFFDIGGRIVWEKKKFSVEIEYIYRINNSSSNIAVIKNNSYKYLFNANFNITQNVVISYYLGKDFDQPFGGNLISGLSLNLGFGDIKLKDVMESF